MLLPIIVIFGVFSRIEIAVATRNCSTPVNPENGEVLYTTFHEGSELTFVCNNGYHLQEDTGQVYCTSEGEWSKTDVKCVAKTCDFPTRPGNGQVSFESLTFRSKLKFTCDDGYFLNSDEPVFCLSDGTWSKTDVQCIAKACDRPEHPENGQVIFSSLDFGSQLKFRCDEGYVLKLNGPVVCTLDRTWNRTDVQCVAKTCDTPEHPDNGQVTFASLNFGSQLKFRCNDGYLLKPNEPVFCTSNGTWNNTDVRCVDISNDNGKQSDSAHFEGRESAATTDQPIVNVSEGLKESNNKCGPPPKVEGTLELHLDNPEAAIGTSITYRCEFGYVNQDSKVLRSTCQWDADSRSAAWTKSDVVCIPRSCGEPGFVPNAHRIGNLFTFPNKVEFQCQEGYKLKGSAVSYCQASGTWSGRLPKCDQITCAPPANPEHGRVRYSSLEYGTELRYECDKRFVLSQHEERTCTADGTWSNTEPVCTEGSCEMPLVPKHGNVQIAGTLKVGTVALYSCKEGRTMVGPSASKCLITGEWTFPPPKCVSPCVLSVIPNGDVGYMETRRVSRYKSEERFVEFQVGKIFKDGETAIFRCRNHFEPVESTQPAEDWRRSGEVVTCRDGQWSKLLECKPESCYGEPPAVVNGYPVVNNRSHGVGINYRCDNYYVKAGKGDVKCSYGQWTGETPECIDSRCYVNQLNYPGLEKPPEYFIEHGKNYTATCIKGYEVSRDGIKVSCNAGKWTVPAAICVEESCYEEPPPVDNGYPVVNNRSHGFGINYHCDNYYMKAGKDDVKCSYGQWTGETPKCIDSRCYASQLNHPMLEKPPVYFIEHGKNHTATCINGFQASREGIKISCNAGKWNIPAAICVKATCDGEPPSMDNGVPVVDNRSHGSGIYYTCDKYYVKSEKGKVKCFDGQWTGHTPTCIDGRCYVSQLNHRGLVKPPVDFIEHGKDYPASCMKGFKAINQWKKILCNAGKWNISADTCVEEICAGEPPEIPNGRYHFQSRNSNSEVVYECDPGYGMSEPYLVHCLQGQWTGQAPDCDRAQPENCFCTLNPGSHQLAAIVNEASLKYDGPIKKGDVAVLFCTDPTMHLLWPNGTHTFGNVSMICDVCQAWGSSILPSCERMQPVGEDTTTTASPKAEKRISRHPENCSCTFKRRSRYRDAVGNEASLEYDVTVKKGDAAALSCKDPRLHLLWPNGMRTLGTVHMTCEVCQAWGSNDLPSCDATQPGDSFIIFSENMKVQPGGAVEGCRGKKLKIECISWNTNYPDWTMPMSLPLSYDMRVDNEQYTAFQSFVHIEIFEQKHTGSYECFARSPRHPHRYLRSTKFDLITDCYGEPQQILYGRYYFQSRSHTSRVEYKCDDGYEMRGNSTVQCLHGKWSGQSPYCIRANYAASVLVGQEATPEGLSYNPTPNPSATKESSSDEEDSCSCTYNNPNRKISAMYRRKRLWYGDKVKKGDWTQLKCTDQTMHLILPNGTKSANETVKLTCIVCKTWEDDQLPTCEISYPPVVTCPQLEETEVMTVKYTNERRVYSMATFSCAAPFVLNGSQTLRCLQTGVWNHMQPICQKPEVFCPPIPETDVFSVQFTNGRKINSTAYFRCKNANFKIVGNLDTRTCLESGEWSGANPDCEAPGCLIGDFGETAPINVLPSMEGVTKDLQPVGSELAMHCEKGWALIEGKTATCDRLGKWNFGRARCVVGCQLNIKDEYSALIITPHKEYYRFGQSVTLSCSEGFELASNVERVLCMDMGWSDPIPNCKEKTKMLSKN